MGLKDSQVVAKGARRIRNQTRVTLGKLGIDGAVMRVWDRGQARIATLRGRSQLGPDGLPVPPVELIEQVDGTRSVEGFLNGGRTGREVIAETLARHDVDVERLDAILDFGVGCGRVARWWAGIDTEVHGCDYNSGLVRWTQRNLPHVTATTNHLDPPLPYDSDRFDLVYVLSVFTHLVEEQQQPWLDELRRVTTVGGHVLFTTIGPTFPHRDPTVLTPEITDRMDRGELIVLVPEHAGRICCATFHPPSWVKENMLDGFELVEYVERGAAMSGGQDLWLVRRVA